MQPALSEQLRAAAQVLRDVQQGRSATAALALQPERLRPGVQSLAYQALRSLGRARALRALLAPRAPPPAVDALLCLCIALLTAPGRPAYPAHTLVNEAVAAARSDAAMRAQAGFLNACLRRLLREQDALQQHIAQDVQARWNHPVWWIDQLRRDHPAHWQALLEHANAAAPMVLRVNVRQTQTAAYVQRLTDAGIAAQQVGPVAVQLQQPCPVQALPGFDQGMVSVQDTAAQMAAPLLLDCAADAVVRVPADPAAAGRGPLRVLDACAAPGGKTAHLLEMADCDLTALDVDAARCERIHQNLRRLGLSARVICADAAHPATWWDGRMFDAVLLDAPCTASAIVRRHPDVRWLRRPTDIAQLAAQQARLLLSLWPLVAPGGHLLYCTCSVFLDEGQRQIQTFLAHNTDALLRPSPGHLLPSIGARDASVLDNPPGDPDSFFYALLQKRTT